MLVLSRRLNESIQIGEDIEVTVIDVRGDVVRLGINAPQKTQIWRKELWDAIVEENRQAALEAQKSSKTPVAAPSLPISTFSKLSKLRTVQPKKKEDDEISSSAASMRASDGTAFSGSVEKAAIDQTVQSQKTEHDAVDEADADKKVKKTSARKTTEKKTVERKTVRKKAPENGE